MKERIYKKIYAISMIIFGLSLVLMLFIQGLTPFGVSTVWSDTGFGSSLMFVRPDSSAQVGETVVKNADIQGKVDAYLVQDVVRQNGALHYRVSDMSAASKELISMPAQDLRKVTVFSIPFAGLWVQMITSTLGSLTLLGLPFFMFLINAIILVGRKLLPVIQLFERKVGESKRRKAEKKEQQVHTEKAYENPLKTVSSENNLVTVLKPYNMKRYGM